MQPVGMLLDAMIEIDQRQLRVLIHCSMDEEQGIFLLPIRIEETRTKDIIAAGELKIAIVNPLGITFIVLFTVGTFGLCMVSAISTPVYELFTESYEASKAMLHEASLGARVHDVYDRVKARREKIVESAKKSFLPCAIMAGGEITMKLLGA